MQAKATCVCRGSGKVYILFELSGFSQGTTPTASIDPVEGRDVPCAIYPYRPFDRSCSEFVVVVPMLEAPRCIVRLRDEHSAEETAHTINFTAAKWESRVNYRLRSELSNAIRDYDDLGEYDHLSMDFWDGIVDGDEVIVPNDGSNETRALLLLQQEDIITLKDGITAAYHDGVLELELPKATPTVPAARQIEIR